MRKYASGEKWQWEWIVSGWHDGNIKINSGAL